MSCLRPGQDTSSEVAALANALSFPAGRCAPTVTPARVAAIYATSRSVRRAKSFGFKENAAAALEGRRAFPNQGHGAINEPPFRDTATEPDAVGIRAAAKTLARSYLGTA